MVCTIISVPLWIPIPNWLGRKNEFIFPLHRRRLVRETIRTMQLPTAVGRTSPGLFLGTATILAVVSKSLETLSSLFIAIRLKEVVRLLESSSSLQNMVRRCRKLVPQGPAPEPPSDL